ncbi:MAG: methyltransferase [Proteobacteria bacterium]|nr:methyltransferase [Pseudomonadota bacterium]
MTVAQRWRERWFHWRNRFESSPAIHARALRNPLIRPIANRRAKALFDLCAGFVYSQILAACVQLRVFHVLQDGPLTVDVLAERLALPPAATARLMEAAAGLHLTERLPGNRYGLGILGLAIPMNPAITAMVEHHAALYADLRDPVALLRGEQPDTALRRLWPYAAPDQRRALMAEEVADYSALMAASQPLVAADILSVYRFDRHRCLLDLGGGDGTFLMHVAAAAPALRLMLFDLPAVAERANAKLAAAGLGERALAVGGDIRIGPLPTGADVMSLVRVVHDHDDDAALAILRAARAALPPGGTLLLAEPMAATKGAETVGAYFEFYLLAMGSGRPRTVDELTDMLRQAGFSHVQALPAPRPMLVRVLRAR